MTSKRYSRQVLLDKIGQSGQDMLSSCNVAIVGCGGLGSIAAPYLAGAGIGGLTLIDGDRPDISNIHRQILYTGKETDSKAIILGNKIKALNPDTELTVIPEFLTKENINEHLTGYDIVLECTDDIMCKYLVNDFCAAENIPLVYGAIYKYEGYISLFRNASDNSINLRDIFPTPDTTILTCSEVGVMNTIAGMIGLLQANECLKYILGIGESLDDILLTYDCLSNSQNKLKLKKTFKKDIIDLFEESDYSMQVCNPDHEITSGELLGDIEKYKILSVMPRNEHVDIADKIEHLLENDVDIKRIAQRSNPLVIYCRSGKTSGAIVSEIRKLNAGCPVYSLRGGYLDFQKTKALS